MITRIPQRTMDDCTICVVAMIMGQSFTYERVLADGRKYPDKSPEGKYTAWWEAYFRDNGFQTVYRPFMDIYDLAKFRGRVLGLLHMSIPHLQRGHVVAVDEFGVVDPSDGAPDHASLQEYILNRLPDGVVFDDEFLAIRRSI